MVGVFVGIALAFGGRVDVATRTQPQVTSDYFDLYDRSRYDEFNRWLDSTSTATSFSTFEAQAGRWVGAGGPAAILRRRLVAATVALEIAHRLRDEPPRQAGEFLVWASRQVGDVAGQQPPSDVERFWYLTAIASMQELLFPWVLSAGLPTGDSALENQRLSFGKGGELATASDRFPDDPRLALGRIAAEEFVAIGWDSAPAFTAFVRKQAAARVFPEAPFREARNAVILRNQAAEILKRRRRIPAIIDEYRALEVNETLRAELALHIGYLESVQEHWPEALAELRRVTDLTTEPVLRYLSWFFAGRIAQVTGDTPGAIAAFEAADAVVPGARSALTLLGAELMRTGGRDEWDRAYALLRRANASDGTADPWWLYGRGDAYLWARHMARLREALR